MKRRTAREKALQTLFQIDVSNIDPKEAITHALDEQESDPFFEELVFGVLEQKDKLDDMISQHLVNWKLDRIANVDRAILRLSVYEMVYQEDIPVSVSMNEAIELAKLFGDDKAPKFVNGVLSNIKNDLKQQ
ncbi:transcription antitermination factor NusB [Bacillus safensis]|jgi:N utilization substance protein B|uniref:Transcription antitermination protein NusB n=12 Tax=Bacillaceae TaxID=186817 RepID=NUSB_BACP2|nr:MULTISPECIES: transcription antitermination factor NusB [Bacillus]A8FF16.1 RecName: Full=Transcription antitermination protein NusB; AltName: Full=Antitermination factor NusB [Bacillus pumilus SAFR-032]KQL38428.1 antitermination protein NusB [Bacillus sp. FJAT-21955]MBW4849748.1 transcription antitermination factor NusB [Bacillaceae bacterium]MBX7002768.1 transcription antitermination factor NusB [Bacillus aerophilus]PNU24252.1 N utilization substance protein B [Bacillus stratosphericus]UY